MARTANRILDAEMSGKTIIFIMFIIFDTIAAVSVPAGVRRENLWYIPPGGGIIIAAEYHFGHRL